MNNRSGATGMTPREYGEMLAEDVVLSDEQCLEFARILLSPPGTW